MSWCAYWKSGELNLKCGVEDGIRKPLSDAPYHSNSPSYTWRSDITGFDPGVLDRTAQSDRVMKIRNAFVLDTSTLSNDFLEQYGLQAGHVALNLDTGQSHQYPLVADFMLNE